LVRRFWEAWESGDLEAVFAFYDPDIVWVQHTGPIEMHGAYLGHDGVRKAWRDWLVSFSTFEVHANSFVDAGDNVIVGFRMSGLGRTSEAPVDLLGWSVHTLRNGRLIRTDVFERKAEALEAVGVSE
jgi:ketosteroid isomerase-like protein